MYNRPLAKKNNKNEIKNVPMKHEQSNRRLKFYSWTECKNLIVLRYNFYYRSLHGAPGIDTY